MTEAHDGQTSSVTTNYERHHPPNDVSRELVDKYYKDRPTPPPITQQPSYGGNIHGITASNPQVTADESFTADWNEDRHMLVDKRNIVSNCHNKITYYVLPPTAYPPGTFHPDNWPPAASPTSIKDDVPLPYHDGGSATANSYVTHHKQYGEMPHSYLIPPQQLEFHVKEPVMVADEGPSDRSRRRRAYLQHLDDLTDHSSKPVPTGAEMQPYRRSAAVSSGHRGSKDPVTVHDEVPYDSARRRRAYLQHLYDVTDRSGKPVPTGARMQPYERSRSVS